MLSCWISFFIVMLCFIMHINAGTENLNESKTSDASRNLIPSIPVHNDTSRDKKGENYDSEPLRNNGRGSHEANAQNHAAENNGTHGIPIDEFQQMIVDEHNKYRRQMCANDLQEDEALHVEAMKRVHNKANGKTSPYSDDYNENEFEIDTGDPSKITSEMIVKDWYDQSKSYDVNKEHSASKFSQLVWKNTKKLGVGHAYDGQKLRIIVLYKPPGNIKGQFATNVGCASSNQKNQANR